MITVRFFVEGDLVTGFRIRGHAGWDESGQDIVCAAVSSAAYMTCNTLTEICRLPCAATADDGEMTLSLESGAARSAQDLLRGFSLHMRSLSRQYPNHIKVIYGGKHNAYH